MMPFCLKYFSMKIKKTTVRALLSMAALVLPTQNRPIDENLVHAALSFSVVVMATGLFYITQQNMGKSLLKGTHAKNPDIVKRKEEVRRYRDFEKRLPVYRNALTSLQERLESARTALEDGSIAQEDKDIIGKWIASTSGSLDKIISGNARSDGTQFDEQFAQFYDLSDTTGKPLNEKYEDIGSIAGLLSLPNDPNYALICEAEKSVCQHRLPIDSQILNKKIVESEEAIEKDIEKKVDDSLKKVEERHPYAEGLIKTTPQILITIGSAILNQANSPNISEGDK